MTQQQLYTLKPMGQTKSELPADFYTGLNDAQKRVVDFTAGPLLVVAGAGSGKTRTLVHRVAKLVVDGVDPQSILLLTFTRKASQEMLRRATGILDHRCEKIMGGTFHGFANIILRRYGSKLGYPSSFTILDRSDAEDLIASIRKNLGLSKADLKFPKKNALLDMFGKIVNTERSLEAILEDEYMQYGIHAAEITKVRNAYLELKKHRYVMDYDDLLTELLRLLEEHSDVCEYLSRQFQYIMVDEYQDTNRIQARIVQKLASAHHNVMVVGDEAQSIYSFRGAKFENIMKFPDLFPNTTVVKLEQNYRSVQPILDITNALISKARDQYDKRLFSEKKSDQKPVYIEAGSDNEQSQFICQKILELREENVPLNQIAVLFRSSSHANDLEIQLQSQDILYVKYGGFKFVETAHIKDLTAYLRVMFNPLDSVSWQRILMLMEGVGPKAADKIIEGISDVARQSAPQGLYAEDEQAQAGVNPNLAAMLSHYQKKSYEGDLKDVLMMVFGADKAAAPSALLDKVQAVYEPFFRQKYDDWRRREGDLTALKDISERFADLESFLTDLSLEPPDASQVDAVPEEGEEEKLVISTIHSAKGLEWHTVFVMSLVDGYLPSFRSLQSDDDIEEERRLLYVAMTRAEENLFLIKPHLEMMMGGSYGHQGMQFSQASRFLDDAVLGLADKWVLSKEDEVPSYLESSRSSYGRGGLSYGGGRGRSGRGGAVTSYRQRPKASLAAGAKTSAGTKSTFDFGWQSLKKDDDGGGDDAKGDGRKYSF